MDLYGISTIDGVKLFACASNGFVYISSDSGLTWINSFTGNAIALYAIDQANDDVLMVLGESNFVGRSIDGGVTWTSLSVFSSGSTGSILPTHTLSMISSTVAFAGSVEGIILQTNTGGEKWFETELVDSEITIEPIYTVSIYSSEVGIAGIKNYVFYEFDLRFTICFFR